MRKLGSLLFSGLVVFFAGCSTGTVNQIQTQANVAAPSGRAFGGQQAINGGTISLWSVGTSGYGSTPTLLYTTSTNSTGGFSFPIASWSSNCTATGSNSSIPLYLTSGGGDSGSGSNGAILLVAALGACNSITTASYVIVNEVTTVAAAYALAQFTSNGNIGSYANGANGQSGLVNAFATANNLVSLSTGLALSTTPGGNGTVPGAEINSLANILASCVNTGNGSAACSSLFSAATPSGGSAPTNTWQAAVDIALNPGHSVGPLYGLSVANAPFQSPLPLTATPNDWTVALSYTGGGLNSPWGIAIDGSGDAWVANVGGNSVSKFNPSGAALSGSGGYVGSGQMSQPIGIAIDGSGSVWVSNYLGSSISELNASGTENALSPFTGGGLNGPEGIAIDGSGNIWAANFKGNNLSKFSSSGTAISGVGGYTGSGQLSGPYGIAIDGSGNVWVSNNSSTSISQFNSSGTANVLSPFSGGGLTHPLGIAADGSGNIWAANTSSISELNSLGAAASGSSGYTGGGLNHPSAVAIDGSGNLWTVNNAGNGLSKFNPSGTAISGSAGYLGGGLNAPEGIAIDGSGNVWATDSSGNHISEFVGAASPVITPLVGGLAGNTTLNGSSSLGTEPGPTYQVSGQINSNTGCSQTALSGITVSINTIPVQTTTTNGSGSFSFANVPNGTYTLTPSVAAASSAFYPATQNVTVNNGTVNVNFTGTLGYTVQGTVKYTGSQTGQAYVSLVQSNCSGGGTVGTSIVTKGAYTIRGVSPGTYTVNAFMDNRGYGAQNAANPAGTSATNAVAVSNANVTGADVTLSDPGTVTLSSAPTLKRVDPINTGVVVQYKQLQNGSGIETPTNYVLQWSTDSSFSTGVSSKTFPAIGTKGGPAFVTGLTDGSLEYFRLYATSAGTPGITVNTTSSTIGPITIGQPTGGNSVTGSVTFTGTANGPLFVGMYDQGSNAVYGQYIPSPVSAQTFTLNVPTGSNYFLFGVVDQNNDGAIDVGDIDNTGNGSNQTTIAISGTTTGESLVLPGASGIAAVTTQNYKSTNGSNTSQNYSVYFQVNSLVKHPVAVSLAGGPNVISPVDIALCTGGNSCGQGFQYGFNIGSSVPNVGDTYTFNVTYSDATTGTLTAQVTGVLNVFATGLSPTTGNGASTMPTFAWIDPVCGPCSSYSYSFTLSDTNGSIWQIPGNNSNSNGFSNSIVSIPWNTDPSGNNSLPSVGSLSTSTTYAWSIEIYDSNNNSSVQQVEYLP